MLQLAFDVGSVDDLDAFRQVVASGLGKVIGADLTSYTEVEVDRGAVLAVCDSNDAVITASARALAHCAHEHPLVTRGRTYPRAQTISDYLSSRRFRGLRLYSDVYGPLGAGDQLAVNLAAHPSLTIGLALNRPRPTFDQRDRQVLELLRPIVTRAYVATVARVRRRGLTALAGTARPAGATSLTPRERDVLALVATGAVNKEVAKDLGISPRTVENHLSSIYRKLGVGNRTAAARVGGGTAGGS